MKGTVKFTVKIWSLVMRCGRSELWVFLLIGCAIYRQSAPHSDNHSAVESDTQSDSQCDTQSAESDTQSVLVFSVLFISNDISSASGLLYCSINF